MFLRIKEALLLATSNPGVEEDLSSVDFYFCSNLLDSSNGSMFIHAK